MGSSAVHFFADTEHHFAAACEKERLFVAVVDASGESLAVGVEGEPEEHAFFVFAALLEDVFPGVEFISVL